MKTISSSGLVAIVAVLSAFAPTALAGNDVHPDKCQKRNCRRAFEKNADDAREFCYIYTEGSWTGSLPTYAATACSGDASKISRGCSHIATANCPAPTGPVSIVTSTATITTCTATDPEPTETNAPPQPTCDSDVKNGDLSNRAGIVLFDWGVSCANVEVCGMDNNADIFTCLPRPLSGDSATSTCILGQPLNLCPLADGEDYQIEATFTIAPPEEDPLEAPTEGCNILACLSRDVNENPDCTPRNIIAPTISEGTKEVTLRLVIPGSGVGGDFIAAALMSCPATVTTNSTVSNVKLTVVNEES